MRILIIDDERSTRESIKVLAGFSEENGDVIYEAVNGLDGFRKIGEVRPDIIFLDMNMPVLDGADFLNSLKKEDFQGRIIVVSGYADFRYTKAAVLKDSVVDYIQKPIDERELKAAIRKIVGDRQFIFAENRSGEGKDGEKPLGVIYGVFVENVREVLKKNFNSSEDMFRYFLMCQFEHQIKETEPYVQEREIYQYAWFFSAKEYGARELEEGLLRTVRSLESRYGIRVYVIYAEWIEKKKTQYMKICDAINYFDMNSKKRVAPLTGVCARRQPKSRQEATLQAGELFLAAENHNRGGFEEELEKIKNRINRCEEISIYEIKIMMSGIAHEIGKRMSARGIEFDSVAERRVSELYSGEILFSIADSLQWVESFGEEIWNVLQDDEAAVPEKLQQMLHYIQENYNRRISLADVAERFHFNTSTVSRMFVRYLNVNYIDYINQLRFEKARELITLSELSISEIAEQTGFESLSYFSRQFKRKYGITPQEYRRK